ncbi:hypothetical protein H0X09_00975 [Candidatus Saccharibacteria bacterium]|nr:hypothetical protein [Candidatus Saccharibacteria bacterium]
MSEPSTERRLVENEVIFRQANETVVEGLEELRADAKALGQNDLAEDTDTPLHFFCECSNEDCRKRIVLKPSVYREVHQNSSQFILIPGHNVLEIERILKNNDDYLVVEKYMTPPAPENVDKLHQTDLDTHL